MLSEKLTAIVQDFEDYLEYKDFQIHPYILEYAFNEIVDGTNCHFYGKEKQFWRVLQKWHYADGLDANDVVGMMRSCDFYWKLLNDYQQVMQKHGLDSTKKAPRKPTTLNEALTWLNVAQIKEVLRLKNEKISGKRADLEERLLSCASMSDVEDLVASKFEEKLKKYNENLLSEKYDVLLHFIKGRTDFYYRITKDFGMQQNNPLGIRWLPRMLHFNDEEQKEFIANKLGMSYDDVIIDGVIYEPVPLLPYDLCSISLKYIPKSSLQNQAPSPKPQYNHISQDDGDLEYYEDDCRSVSLLLGFGIFLAPYIFAWFTLRQGHSVIARSISFAWLIIFIVAVLN